jgi:hypothetical protein
MPFATPQTFRKIPNKPLQEIKNNPWLERKDALTI